LRQGERQARRDHRKRDRIERDEATLVIFAAQHCGPEIPVRPSLAIMQASGCLPAAGLTSIHSPDSRIP
jgi:hypothetical protein